MWLISNQKWARMDNVKKRYIHFSIPVFVIRFGIQLSATSLNFHLSICNSRDQFSVLTGVDGDVVASDVCWKAANKSNSISSGLSVDYTVWFKCPVNLLCRLLVVRCQCQLWWFVYLSFDNLVVILVFRQSFIVKNVCHINKKICSAVNRITVPRDAWVAPTMSWWCDLMSDSNSRGAYSGQLCALLLIRR